MDISASALRMSDPAFFLDPQFHVVLRELRHAAPVHWTQAWPERGFWSITRYADIKSVLEQPLLFSSEAAGNIIPADPNFFREDRAAKGFNTLPTNTDPPKHDEVRRLFARTFSGPAVAKLEAETQAIVDDILDEVRDRDSFNFVLDAAAHLPARLICQLLGVPRQDWPLITRYANSFASFADPAFQLGSGPAETFHMSMTFLFGYITRLVEARRQEPRDDFASLAAGAQLAGAPLPEPDAAWWVFSILAAGFETSRNIVSGGLLALVEHPEQFELLRQTPALLQNALDEMIRFTNPATALLRVAAADTEVAGQAIARDDWVVVWLDSANRDETVFTDPFRFDITARRAPSMSFGYGVHNCIGRMLAILEAKVMIRTILQRVAHVEIVGPIERTASTIAKGAKVMPVRFTWKDQARAAA